MFLSCKSLSVCLYELGQKYFSIENDREIIETAFFFSFLKNVRFKNVFYLSLNHDINFSRNNVNIPCFIISSSNISLSSNMIYFSIIVIFLFIKKAIIHSSNSFYHSFCNNLNQKKEIIHFLLFTH